MNIVGGTMSSIYGTMSRVGGTMYKAKLVTLNIAYVTLNKLSVDKTINIFGGRILDTRCLNIEKS